ncbi:autotransporter outer membrane beta-barrel domain-containing protein [Stenotrophomonas sp. WHRI 8082]|uniref:autotransporter family protein n=1 Tax=Stenotrophomonas sp. WHRI 8082 TaxID=3162571 RepID=UPI0032EE9207
MQRSARSPLFLCIASLLTRRAFAGTALLVAALPAGANCVTTGTTTVCDATVPNPWTSTVGSGDGGPDDSRTVEVQSGAGVVVNNASVVSFAGVGNVLSNSGTLTATNAAAIGFDNSTGRNRVVNTGTGVIQADGTAIAATGGGALDFINAGLVTGNVVLGAGDDLLDLSGRIDGSVDQGAGNDTAILRAGGTLAGALAQGAGNDRLEVQGGVVNGATTQGAGDDTAVLSAGTLASLDQGDGVDSLQISGGSVTGTVQQGNGIDNFLMTDGTLGALLQGDNYDSFRMTGGRIIGAFEDGDYAEMTGGRIGRVNMKLDNNVFDMSGGTIDGNLVTGFGRDTIILSDGYIGGNISVSGGDDSVTLTGGTVRGEIRMSVGNDTLDWSGGGVVHDLIDMGEGNDTARLSNLNESHLGAVPRLEGGVGVDALVMDNVKSTAVARYAGWESIALRNDSQLIFDGTLVLGDIGTATGTLDIDPTSALFGSGANGISAFTAGALATVINAGRLDMSSNDVAGDVFTVNGNYTGNGGGLYLNTVLGDDSSASDRLVVSGGTASGTTGIGVFNAGGGGAATVADGILLVQASNGATTTADAFALFNPLSVGAYEYFLFKGGVNAGTGENWYLRSTIVASADPAPAPPPVTPPLPEPPPPEPIGTPPPVLPPAPPPPPDVPVDPGTPDPDPVAPEPAPPPAPAEPAPVAPPVLETPPAVPDEVAVVPGPLALPPTPGARPSQAAVTPIYRLETPAYAVVPSLLRTVSQASLGTFHERQGEQRLLVGQGAARGAWGRLIGSSEEQHWNGDALTGFDGDLQGLQAGIDLYASGDETFRSQWGVFVGRTRATGRITGLALGWENVQVGQTRLDDKHVGLSWTGVGSAGGYLDAVVMQSRYRGEAWSTRGLGIDVRGDGTSASLEAGKPLLRFGQSAWWLEPQLQVIWQRQSLDDAADAVAAIGFGADTAWTGRIGLRIAGDYGLADNGWQPYFKLNYWKTLDGDDRVDFGSNRIVAGQETSAWEVGVGVVGRFNRNVSAYAVADYTRDLEDRNRERKSVEGNIGLRFDW